MRRRAARARIRSLWRSGLSVAAAALWIAAAGHSSAGAAQRPVWALDPSHTTIAFSIDAAGFPRTDGVFRQFDGTIGVDLKHPANSRVGFRVRSGSIDVSSDVLADLLRGRLFLDADRFADISFVSTSVEKLDERTVRVAGGLTMLGVTRPLTVDVEVRQLAARPRVRLGLTAKARIDRLAFGMREGYPLISKTVDLVVTSEAVEH